MNRIKQADEAVKFQDKVQLVIWMVLVFLGCYGAAYLTTVGEDLRQARLAAERLELPEAPTHSWAAHPNDSQRIDAWKRVCDREGLNWSPTAQGCL